MHGLTDYITAHPWVDVFTTWYVLVDTAYQAIIAETGQLRQRGPQPTFSDSEVITVALIAETFFHGHEELCLSFIRQYHHALFPRLLDDTRFNRRRRLSAGLIEAVRQFFTAWLIAPDDPVRLVDSAPIPVCTYMRSPQCQTVLGSDYCGVMTSRRAKLYGFRIHFTTTTTQVVDQWMLAPASYWDGKLTPALLADVAGLWVIGDNAFHDPTAIDWLQQQRHIRLTAIQRRDARIPWPRELRTRLNNLRRTIESALSVLCTVFHLEQPGSRSLSGLIARISTRLLAYTLSFLMWTYLPSIEN
jgi:hypothetical protein